MADKLDFPSATETLPDHEADALNAILAQLRTLTNHDFTQYKRPTILRRLRRRMQNRGCETIPVYLAHLHQQPEEFQALCKDFLIMVTRFFRDPDAFHLLEQQIIPQLFAGKSQTDSVRVWIPGCATGQEAYSLAMLLCEHKAALPEPPELQIFATDIDAEAIAFAREGFYSTAAVADIAPARVQAFFSGEPGGYRIKKHLREVILFTTHNLLSDPPFSRLDLVSCRNLLIYFSRESQDKAIALFHYALNPGGFLCVGSSETADSFFSLFRVLDKKERIYQRHANDITAPRFAGAPLLLSREKTIMRPSHEGQTSGFIETYQKWRLRRYAPPGLLVIEHYDIVHVFGDAGRYLQLHEGPATLNVLQEILAPLRRELHTALYSAFHNGEHTTSRPLHLEVVGEWRFLRLSVGPVAEPGFPAHWVEVVFEEAPAAPVQLASETPAAASENQLITHLEEELQRTKERLQTVISEYETTHDELKASNEELQSMNEEVTTVNHTPACQRCRTSSYSFCAPAPV
jgi:two-component system CheB/CheR fusion protein